MTETRVIVACIQRQVHWYLGAEPARCTDPDHQHRQVEVHRHRSVVSLPDGTTVTAVSFDAVDPYTRDQQPDYGLYLDGRWQPPWAHDHLDWPDFGIPGDPALVLVALRSALHRGTGGSRLSGWPRPHRYSAGMSRRTRRPSRHRRGRLGPRQLLPEGCRDPRPGSVHHRAFC